MLRLSPLDPSSVREALKIYVGIWRDRAGAWSACIRPIGTALAPDTLVRADIGGYERHNRNADYARKMGSSAIA
jgi:hypothetical protein